MRGRSPAAPTLQFVALALALAAALVVLFAPLYASSSSMCDPAGVACVAVPVARASALAVNGAGILAPALALVLLTLVPLVVRGRAWRATAITCAVLLGMFVVIALLSIGAFFVPALVVAIVVAARQAAPATSG